MVIYKCIYCQKLFEHKGHFEKHNKINFKCIEFLEDQIQYYKNLDKIKMLNELNQKNMYMCEDCKMSFTCFTDMKNHFINNCCIDKNVNKSKKNKLVKTTNIINNNNAIINTANTVNINNNFNLIPFDKIKYDYVPEEVLKQIFEVPGEALPLMTKVIFFDKSNPENNIIFCPNLGDKYVYVYTNSPYSKDGWERQYKEDFYSTLMTRQLFSLDLFKELLDDDENYLNILSFDGYVEMSKAVRTNKKIKKEYMDKIAYISYDNRDLVKKTRDRLLT